MRPRFLVLITALLCGAVLASSAGAAEPAPVEASFALKPVMYDPALTATKSYFILALKPGALIKDQVRIVNTGGKIGTAFLYPVDATTGQTSGAVYLSRQSPRRDVASWVVLSRSRVTLAPGADAVVPFTVRVPKSARPGDHLGGIVAENSQIQKSSNRGALQIKIRHLTIAAVEAQLPGAPVATVAATGVKAGGEHGYQYVYVHMKSTGNVLIKPAATLTVRNAKGRVVARRQMQLDTFVPGTEIDYPALLPRQALKPGRYTADVRLSSSKNRVLGYRKAAPAPFDVTRTFPFTVTSDEQTKVFSGVAPVTPPQPAAESKNSKRNYELAGMAGVIGLLVVILLLLLLRLRRRRKCTKAPSTGPVPIPGPQVTVAAQAVTAPEAEQEEPGWASLLAAYESQPRHQTNGWHKQHAVEEVEPEPNHEPKLQPVAFAAAAEAPEHGSEPGLEEVSEPGSEQVPEQVPEWGQTPAAAEVPVESASSGWFAPHVEPAIVGPAGMAAAAAAVQHDFDPEPVPRLELAPEPGPEPEPEPRFELQPEPWFEPEPEVEYLPDPQPGPHPDPEVLLMAAEWFSSQHEREIPDARTEPRPQPPTVMAPDDLEHLIVRHDRAVAESYFRADDSQPQAAAEPEPAPAQEPEPAPAPPALVPEPMPQALVPKGAPGNPEADPHNLSSALVEASLIALAAVLATRLIKSSD